MPADCPLFPPPLTKPPRPVLRCKIKACFYNTYHNHAECAVDSPYMVSNFQFAKLLEATVISTLQETSTCFLLMRVTQVRTEENKDYVEKKKLALLFAFLLNIAKTSRYTHQNVSVGPHVPAQKPFLLPQKEFSHIQWQGSHPLVFSCYLSRTLPGNRIHFCAVWCPQNTSASCLIH